MASLCPLYLSWLVTSLEILAVQIIVPSFPTVLCLHELPWSLTVKGILLYHYEGHFSFQFLDRENEGQNLRHAAGRFSARPHLNTPECLHQPPPRATAQGTVTQGGEPNENRLQANQGLGEVGNMFGPHSLTKKPNAKQVA